VPVDSQKAPTRRYKLGTSAAARTGHCDIAYSESPAASRASHAPMHLHAEGERPGHFRPGARAALSASYDWLAPEAAAAGGAGDRRRVRRCSCLVPA
jgi:hypothetical protein